MLQAQQSQAYWIALTDCNCSSWFCILMYLKSYLSLYTLKLESFDVFQAYIMELEAEVAKLKETNEELQKKQVQLKFP
jgi:hypothetical protein